MVTRRQAPTPPEVVLRLLRSAGNDAVLIGGQALIFWTFFYGLKIPEAFPTISNDSDFLMRAPGDREPLDAMAKTLGVKPVYASKSAMSALVGQAELILSDEEAIHVDAVFQVIGLDPQSVRDRAQQVELPDPRDLKSGPVQFRVMHQLDLLRSRLANLYQLRDKQNAKGEMQLRVAIDVAREFVRAEAKTLSPEELAGRSRLVVFVSEIEKLARDDAGRKTAERLGIHVADAIDPSLIPAGPFWEKKWQHLKPLMSAGYGDQFQAPGESMP